MRTQDEIQAAIVKAQEQIALAHQMSPEQETTSVHLAYIDIASGDLIAGVVLSELISWYIPGRRMEEGRRVNRNGHEWVVFRRDSWWDAIRISPTQCDRAIKALEKQGLIIKKTFKYKGDVALHLRIDIDVFLSNLNKHLEAPAPQYLPRPGFNRADENIQAQYERQKGRCYYAKCGHAPLGDTFHVEHVVPLSRGGTNDMENIVLACPKCNLSKNAKRPHEWPEGGRLL